MRSTIYKGDFTNIATPDMESSNLNKLFKSSPYLIAGPCSAESPEQLDKTVAGLKEIGINVIRAGSWKPRSRPNTFEGKGTEALSWLKDIKQKYDVKTAVEVAGPQHVEQAIANDMDILWIGARTSVNPFVIQEIAEALKGASQAVLIKNPINPDLALWIGGVERISKAGVSSIGAIHRGFSSFQPGKYRNTPVWQIPIEFKRAMPEIPLFCDPSHIAGKRSMIKEVCQMALDFNYDGLMIESHYNPEVAWSDAKQQLTPQALGKILSELTIRDKSSDDDRVVSDLQELRNQIDEIDRELVEIIARRMQVIDQVADYKKKKNIAIFQLERWKNIIQSRPTWANKLGLDTTLIEDIYKAIHTSSLKRQTKIYNKDE